MADKTDNESITEVVPKALGAYLLGAIRDLKEAYTEFPSANQRLEMPSVSIHVASPEFANLQPYPSGKRGTVPALPADQKTKIDYVVGMYNFTVQVDLWARSKEERRDLYDLLFNALNPDIVTNGLVLTLEDYFNQLCSYLYVRHNMADSEERSQRDEWRVTLELLANCKAIRQKEEFICTQSGEVITEVLDIAEEDDDI